MLPVIFQLAGVGQELAPQLHRRRVLQHGAPHLDDVLELARLAVQRDDRVAHLALQAREGVDQGQSDDSLVAVVRLGQVHVLGGAAEVLPELTTQ